MTLIEEDKWLVSVTSFATPNSVFNIAKENKVFQSLHQVIGNVKWPKKLLAN